MQRQALDRTLGQGLGEDRKSIAGQIIMKGTILLVGNGQDVSWVGNFKAYPKLKGVKTVYLNGADSPSGILNGEGGNGIAGQNNGGYIRWILDHYDELPDWVIFSQADPFEHVPVSPYEDFTDAIEAYEQEVVLRCKANMNAPFYWPIGKRSITSNEDPMVRRVRDRPRSDMFAYGCHPLKDACHFFFKRDAPKILLVSYGDIHFCNRASIKQYNRQWWQELYDWVTHRGEVVKTFECGALEKLWPLILDPLLWENEEQEAWKTRLT